MRRAFPSSCVAMDSLTVDCWLLYGGLCGGYMAKHVATPRQTRSAIVQRGLSRCGIRYTPEFRLQHISMSYFDVPSLPLLGVCLYKGSRLSQVCWTPKAISKSYEYRFEIQSKTTAWTASSFKQVWNDISAFQSSLKLKYAQASLTRLE